MLALQSARFTHNMCDLVSHSSSGIIWHLLADRAARFADLGDDYYINTIGTDRRARSHIRQLQALGFTVTLTPAAA
jgi:transposase